MNVFGKSIDLMKEDRKNSIVFFLCYLIDT